MIWTCAKLALTCTIVIAVSEVAKRSSLWGAILASIPLISVLGILWLYVDTRDAVRVSRLSTSIFWLVLPSLGLFLALPLLLRWKVNFYVSLGVAIAVTACGYLAMAFFLSRAGMKV